MKNETSSTAFAIHQRYHARSNMPSKLFLIAIALTTFNLSNTLPPQNAVADEVELLTAKQQSVTQRYQRLEELLLRLAEVEATENPERSALLRRAAKQSRDKFVLEKLKLASSSLKTQEFQKTVLLPLKYKHFDVHKSLLKYSYCSTVETENTPLLQLFLRLSGSLCVSLDKEAEGRVSSLDAFFNMRICELY